MFINFFKVSRCLILTAVLPLLLAACIVPPPVPAQPSAAASTAVPAGSTAMANTPTSTSTPKGSAPWGSVTAAPSATASPTLAPSATASPTLAPSATITPPPTLTPTVMLTAEPSATFPAGRMLEDVPFCFTPGGDPLLMDISFPPVEAARYPAVIFIHGGGLEAGNKKNLVPLEDLTHLVQGGNIFVSINYRLAPDHKFPSQIEDAQCAVRSLRAHADQYYVDPELIGVMGYSSGAHLAALIGTSDSKDWPDSGQYGEQSSRVQAVVVLSGPAQGQGVLPGSNQRWLEEVYGTADINSPLIQQAAPLAYITPDDPPFLILHGLEDAVIPFSQAQMLEKGLKDNAVPVQLVPVMGTGHDVLAPWADTQPGYTALVKIVREFLTRTLAPEP